jgi:hypothetical protein
VAFLILREMNGKIIVVLEELTVSILRMNEVHVPQYSTLNVGAVGSFEMSVDFYLTT